MSSRLLTRVLVAVLLGALCGLAGTSVVVLVADRDRPDGRSGSAVVAGAAAVATDAPRDVLRRWDAARAAAWTSGDAAALAALYTPGSVAGQRDVARLRAWNARGQRVTALVTQVLALRVLEHHERRLVLRVTDRLAEAEAGAVSLPRDEVSTRTIVLGRGDPHLPWRVASVTDWRGRWR